MTNDAEERTDMSVQPPPPDDRPASLDEALGGDTDDIRSLWDGLAEAPTEPAVAPSRPGPDTPSAAGSPSASPTAPAGPLEDRLLVEPVAPPAVPPGPVEFTDLPPAPTFDDPDESDDEVELEGAPSRKERRAARRVAKLEKRAAKDRRRSDKLELRRHRILPRTVIGISMLLLAAAVGAAASGAGLYAYYDWRLSENEDRVGVLTETLETRLTQANEDIENVQNAAVNNIRTAAEPLEQLLADTRTVSDLTPAIAPSVFFISTLDEDGAPSVGSGFVVSSDSSQSLILTSYRTVEASTVAPAPDIEVRGEGDPMKGRLHSWDADRDLALVIVDRGDLPALSWASEAIRSEALGRRVYVASGLGGAGVSLSPGLVVDQSQAGIQHSAAVGNAWQGGPLLTAEGEVLGIASIVYAPLGFDPGGVPFAIPVDVACERVLTCSGGDVTG